MPTSAGPKKKKCVVCARAIPRYGYCDDCAELVRRLGELHRTPRRRPRLPRVYRVVV